MTAATTRPPRAPVQPRIAMVRVEDVVFHPSNVRVDLGDLRDLADSIQRIGLLQPIVVEVYGSVLRLRAGHRRVAAARLAGVTRLPAVIHPEPLAEADWVLHALHENTKRRGLDPAERAAALKRLKQLGRSTTEIARHLGVSEGTIRNWAAGVEATVAAPEPDDDTPAGGHQVPRFRDKAPIRPRKSIGTPVLARFTRTWRDYPAATLDTLLAALDRLAETGRVTDALPDYSAEE